MMEEITNPNSVPDVSSGVGAGATISRPGTGKIWTVEGDEALEKNDMFDENTNNMYGDADEETDSGNNASLSEEDTKILLEKEFDDYYEDRAHKSAGPVVFLSKCLGMLPVIWTDDDAESDCKSYFNLYTFVVFLAWIGVAVISGMRVELISNWPAGGNFTGDNVTHSDRFLGRMTVDTYLGSVLSNALIAIMFGIFKCTNFAEVLYSVSQLDSQLELKEKHYDKIKRKTLYWVVVEIVLLLMQMVGVTFMFEDIYRDCILLMCILCSNMAIAVLDLQYIHMCMVLCKRFRTLNKIIEHIIKPFRTFRAEEPTNEMLQKILAFRYDSVKKEEASKAFDDIWEPSEKDNPTFDYDKDPVKIDITKEDVPPALLMKGNESEISRDEEATVMIQLDILRGIHSDLHHVSEEVNTLLGFQMLANMITNVVIVIMFGFFTIAGALDGNFYWPFLIIMLTPALRLMLVGHWGQIMKDTSMKPFWTISQMSTLDGSPKLERQVQKFSLQASQKAAGFKASGYFYLSRNMVTRIFGVVSMVVFVLVKFDRLERIYLMGGRLT